MAAKIRNCLGVDIGSQKIRIAHMEMGKTGPRVLALVEKELELDPSLNEAQRTQATAKQLAEMLKSSKIRTKKAVFCVPGQTVFVRQFPLPKSSPDRLKRMVSFEARQRVPLPLDKTIMEFQVFEGENENEVYVLLVAIKKDFVMNFMKLVRRSGLSPIAISVSSIALYNFHELNTTKRDLTGSPLKKKEKPKEVKKTKGGMFGKKNKKGEPEPVEEVIAEEEAPLEDMGFEEIQAYVNCGASLMDLAIPKPGASRMIGFTRSVPLGGNEMDRAVRDKLGFDGLPQARAVKERDSVVLSTDFEIEGDPSKVNMEASEAVTGIADRIISELRRSLDYYISQPDGVAVDSIVLSGGLARQKFLSNYIEEKMGVPVSLAEPKPERVRLPDDAPEPVCPYVIAMGLAAQGLGIAQNNINFLPEEMKTIQGISPFEVAGMTVMLLAIIGLSIDVGSGHIVAYKKATDEISDQIGRLHAQSLRIANEKTRHEKVHNAYKLLGSAAGGSNYWFDFLANFIKHRPPDILIDQLELRVDGNVIIRGKSPTVNSVLQFQKELADMTKGKVDKTPENPDGAMPVVVTANPLVRDPRYKTEVFAFEIIMKTYGQLGRFRVIGEDPTQVITIPAPGQPGFGQPAPPPPPRAGTAT